MPETAQGNQAGPLLILGASARAAASSARRSGFEPWTGDLFADVDLRRIAHAAQVNDYPHGLAAVAAAAPDAEWLYTGGLENHPELVDRIAASRRLLGNAGDVLRAVRDPLGVADVFRQAGLPCPAVRASDRDVPSDGTWLRKRRRSSGGAGVEPWHGPPAHCRLSLRESSDDSVPTKGRYATTIPAREPVPDHCFQKRISGQPCAGLFVAAGGRCVLLGVTRQLLVDRFRYAGSIGPTSDPGTTAAMRRIGHVLADAFRLVGLFGVDVVVNDEGVWPVEVNPRLPASAEVLERACGFSAVQIHVDACRAGRLPATPPLPGQLYCGKRIVYARVDCTIPAAFGHFAERAMASTDWPALADVPAVGGAVSAGWPVTTVFAEGPEERDVEAGLAERVGEVERLLG